MAQLTRLPRPSTTIIGSSRAFTLGSMLLALGCTPTARTVNGPAEHHEAPAHHLRDTAESHRGEKPLDHTDPIADPAAKSGVSLGGILAYADRHSPLLAVARSTRSRAEAMRIGASPLLPSSPELTVAAGPRFGPTGTGLDVEVNVMQQLELSGERGLRLDAAYGFSDLTNAEIEQIRWLVHCDVHAAFHQSLVEQERASLAARVVAFQAEVLRVVERQIAAGEAAPLTLRLAQAEVAQAQQELVAVEQSFLASRIRLGRLAGWPSSTPPMPAGTVDSAREPPAAAELIRVAREKLPSLRVGAARVHAAQARVVLAEGDQGLRPSIGAQYGRDGDVTNEGVAHSVLGIVSIPFTSAPSSRGQRASARAEVTVAQAEFAAQQQLLDAEIAEAHSEVVAAAQRTRAYGTEILPRFEENLTLLRRSFELGEIDILALSTGRERFLRIQSDALTAQLDYFVALAGLERVVGVDLWRDDHHEEHSP
jgi:outer membrane protein, heavy metal efflux system